MEVSIRLRDTVTDAQNGLNDLPSAIKFAIAFEFAGDTKCYIRIKTTEDILHLQEDIDSIFSWSIKDNLLLNLSKCVFMQLNQAVTHHAILITPY